MRNTCLLMLACLAGLLPALDTSAGTLDDAPFRFAPATKDWKIDDSNLRQMAEGTYLVATLSNPNQSLSMVILKTDMNKSQTNAFEEFYGGIRDSLNGHHIKVLLDEPATFLGFKAHRFAYETPRPDSLTNYSESMLFATPANAWCISTIGLQNKTNDVRQTFLLFQKKP